MSKESQFMDKFGSFSTNFQFDENIVIKTFSTTKNISKKNNIPKPIKKPNSTLFDFKSEIDENPFFLSS
tara:strand:+ start:5804 stop:6010 length:207 start_codon:yes stop_codon:yes gene_type:complete